MSALRSSVKFVRRELGNMAGEAGMRAGASVIRGTIKSLRDRARLSTCPACSEGKLYPIGVVNGIDCSGMTGCSRCEYFQMANQDLGAMRHAARDRVREMSVESRRQIYNGHVRMSRLYYCVSVLLLIGDGYVLIAGGSMLSVLCLSGFGIAVLARGIQSAYRGWQVRVGRFFEEGLFKKWLRMGEWVV